MTNPTARFARKLLGIEALRKHRANAGRDTATVQPRKPGGESVWLRAPEVAATAGGAGEVPWQELPERRAARSIWLYRALLVVLLGLPWAVGVAKMTHPAEAAAPVATAPAAPFPDAAASAIAERFAVSYLSWDHDAPTVRSSALVQDVPDSRKTTSSAGTATATRRPPTRPRSPSRRSRRRSRRSPSPPSSRRTTPQIHPPRSALRLWPCRSRFARGAWW